MNILRRADVAKILGVNPVSIDNWVRQGRFPKPFRIAANRPVWDEKDLESWLETKKGEANGTSINEAESNRPS